MKEDYVRNDTRVSKSRQNLCAWVNRLYKTYSNRACEVVRTIEFTSGELPCCFLKAYLYLSSSRCVVGIVE